MACAAGGGECLFSRRSLNVNDLLPLLGGVLIGLSATWTLLSMGRIAGISGIWAQAIHPSESRLWQWMFLTGLLLGGALVWLLTGMPVADESPVGPAGVAIAGLLVGVGTRMGSGCTSGHGVCGISRLSPRSLVSTLTFIATGAITVILVRLVLGGAA
jgi:uncharacterized membrane protein YedE/YeeE